MIIGLRRNTMSRQVMALYPVVNYNSGYHLPLVSPQNELENIRMAPRVSLEWPELRATPRWSMSTSDQKFFYSEPIGQSIKILEQQTICRRQVI